MSNIANLTKQISKRLVTIAEVALWGVISVSVYKLFFNGIVTLSSLFVAVSISSITMAAILYLVGALTNKRDK